MFSDIDNIRKMVELLGDEGFVEALTNAEELVEDVDETLDRVERIEGDAEAAVREANEALVAVDNRLAKFDETISLLEAKIEAGFSAGFFFFGLNSWLAGDVLIAAGLFFMGLLGVSSLAVTVATMPQVRRLRQAGRYAVGRFGNDAGDEGDDERDASDGN
ncbi:MAG: hypothetical protein ACI8U4_001246 [Natronomonas sp.]|jgi:hypothetical protein